VCGTDGETYGSECYLESAACATRTDITVFRRGECADGNIVAISPLYCHLMAALLGIISGGDVPQMGRFSKLYRHTLAMIKF